MQIERLALKVAEAGEALGYGRAKAYEMVKTGELPSCLVGKERRVPVDVVRQMLADRVAADVRARRDLQQQGEAYDAHARAAMAAAGA